MNVTESSSVASPGMSGGTVGGAAPSAGVGGQAGGGAVGELRMPSLGRRMASDRAFFILVCILATIACIPLFLILWELLVRGYQQINIAFFTQGPPTTLEAMMAKKAGDLIPGGIANGIVGTLTMVLTAAIVAIPLGVLIGVFLAEHPKSRYSNFVRLLVDTLQGTPSIVVGIIMYEWLVQTMGTYSGLAGTAALGMMMLPLMIRSSEETISLLPGSLKEAALALGASYPTVIFRIILPSAFSGLSTGAILAIARTMGETAPLIMTALGSTLISMDLTKPMSSVPLLIWEFYNDPNLMELVWSSSLFLLLLVLTLNMIARAIARRQAGR